ncbi:MAG: hypothetical protein KJO97_09470 [Acidimicrobiia bacterium]|nr:hypothetical protein [Acidimicrobiia bacterium]
MSLRRSIPAGLVDTGATALASFLVQAYAVRVFEADLLGAYALFFSAYLLANLTPQFLVLYPLEIWSLRLSRPDRLGLLYRSGKLAAAAPVTAGAGVLLAALFVTGETTGPQVLRLALTSGLVAVTAPFYEHLKRMMHLSERSSWAAATAVAQLVLSATGIGLAVAADLEPVVVPFGVLAVSQAGAIWFGLAAIRRRPVARVDLATPTVELMRSGRWLLVAGLGPAGAVFAGAALVSHLAGSDQLGYAQAAHVAARPVLVLAAGLAAVLGFRMMEAGAIRSATAGIRFWKVYAMVLGVGSSIYLLVVAVDWVGNPLAALLPRAYEVQWLVAVTIAANLLASLIRPARDELIGAGRELRVAQIDVSAAGGVVVVAALAGSLEAFAIPLGVLAFAAIQIGSYIPARKRLYAGEVADPS